MKMARGRRRHWSDPIMASNYPLLMLAFFFGDAHGVVLACSAIASLLYHRSAETECLEVDRALAMAAFLSSLALMRTAAARPGIFLLLLADIFLAFVALNYSNKRGPREKKTRRTLDNPGYNLWHTAWHLFIVAGQILLLIAKTSPPLLP